MIPDNYFETGVPFWIISGTTTCFTIILTLLAYGIAIMRNPKKIEEDPAGCGLLLTLPIVTFISYLLGLGIQYWIFATTYPISSIPIVIIAAIITFMASITKLP